MIFMKIKTILIVYILKKIYLKKGENIEEEEEEDDEEIFMN